MKDPQGKKKLATSSAALISIGLHVAIIIAAGSWIAFKFIIPDGKSIQVEAEKKLERRKLQMPVKAEPFIEQMSKPKARSTTRIAASTPQLVNITESGDYVRLAPAQTFKESYTNFVSMDRTLEINSKYRTIDFGITAFNVWGTKRKAEKAVIVIDASKSMLYDDCGGQPSYQMVKDDLAEILETLRSATLFNLILFDGTKVALFKPELTPATPGVKKEMIEWFGAINTTNLSVIGISDEMNNFSPKKQYDTPMAQKDIAGWLKGYQAAVEMQPETIFILSSEWGSVNAVQNNISYFLNESKYRAYQTERADYFLISDQKEENDEFLEETTHLQAAAIKMLELENAARLEAGNPHKIVRDWDDILYENGIEMPVPPIPDTPLSLKISAAETRYTMAEVLETIFTLTVDNYRKKGFPLLNIIMFQAEGLAKNNEEGSSKMTSEAKFTVLAKMCNGRFDYLKGMPKVENVLSQSLNDVEDVLEENE